MMHFTSHVQFLREGATLFVGTTPNIVSPSFQHQTLDRIDAAILNGFHEYAPIRLQKTAYEL